MDGSDLHLAFSVALTEELRQRAQEDITLLPFLAPLVRGLRDGFEEQPLPKKTSEQSGLDGVMQGIQIEGMGEAFADLVAPVFAATPWRPVLADHPDIDPMLSSGLQAAHIYGPMGPLKCDGMRGGFFYLAPNIHYPLHTHTAAELYLCLSGNLVIRHGIEGEAFNLSAGDYSITSRNRLHSLTTQDAPVLLYFSWVNDSNDPIYWWQKDDMGAWERFAWERGEDGSWHRGALEPVSEEMIEEQIIANGEGRV